MGSSLYRNDSTERGAPYMGSHFTCGTSAGGWLSLGAARVNKVDMWLYNYLSNCFVTFIFVTNNMIRVELITLVGFMCEICGGFRFCLAYAKVGFA